MYPCCSNHSIWAHFSFSREFNRKNLGTKIMQFRGLWSFFIVCDRKTLNFTVMMNHYRMCITLLSPPLVNEPCHQTTQEWRNNQKQRVHLSRYFYTMDIPSGPKPLAYRLMCLQTNPKKHICQNGQNLFYWNRYFVMCDMCNVLRIVGRYIFSS